MNRLVSLLILICLTSFVYAGGQGQGAAVHTLVIDPGHGGMDPGAIGPGGHHESDLALAVSLKFGEKVKEAFPDVKIIYTRTTDKFVSLADRADMANKAKADLFICIHLNSATNHEAYGTATYVLGLHRTDDNLEIAKRENSVIDLEGDKDKKYEFDPNSPEGHIIMSMKQNAFLDQSILIASKIEDELAMLSKRKSHGVKQAGFWVLYKTAMPSLLAEIGFISNPTEEVYLASDGGQENIASSIFKAFRSYKNEIEGHKDTQVAVAKTPTVEKKTEVLTTSQPQSPKTSQPEASKQPQEAETPKATAAKSQPQEPQTAKQQEAKSQPQTTTSQNPPAPKKEEQAWVPDTSGITPVTKTNPPKEPAKEENYTPVDKVAVAAKDTQQIKMRTAPAETMTKKVVPVRTADEATTTSVKKEEPKPAKPKETAKPIVDTIVKKATTTAKAEAKTSKPAPSEAKKDTVKTIAAKKEPVTKPVAKEPATKPTPKESVAKSTETQERVVFTVQLIAARHVPKNYDQLVDVFGLINREDIDDGVVRYMAGQYGHYKEAQKTLELAKTKGFPEAFIIAYVNDVRLDVKKTKELGLTHP